MLQITDEELIKYIKLCEVQLNTFVFQCIGPLFFRIIS